MLWVLCRSLGHKDQQTQLSGISKYLMFLGPNSKQLLVIHPSCCLSTLIWIFTHSNTKLTTKRVPNRFIFLLAIFLVCLCKQQFQDIIANLVIFCVYRGLFRHWTSEGRGHKGHWWNTQSLQGWSNPGFSASTSQQQANALWAISKLVS